MSPSASIVAHTTVPRYWPATITHALFFAACVQVSAGLRIAYVVSTWWPKIDGAAIAVMGHVQHFIAQGHDTLVVRPEVNKVLLDEAMRAKYVDPLPSSDKLSFVDTESDGRE